jgi:DNA-binding MarR family transcriptional regulator
MWTTTSGVLDLDVGRYPVDDRKLGRRADAARAAAELIDALIRDVHSRAFGSGLNPAQWAALRFFAGANPSARTVTGFAEAHRTTKGTATQTIAALIRKGYLTRTSLPEDRRRARLDLTGSGHDLLLDDPLSGLAEAICNLPAEQQMSLAETLSSLAAQSMNSRSRLKSP